MSSNFYIFYMLWYVKVRRDTSVYSERDAKRAWQKKWNMKKTYYYAFVSLSYDTVFGVIIMFRFSFWTQLQRDVSVLMLAV